MPKLFSRTFQTKLEISQNGGYLVGGPDNKDYSTFGSILGYLNFGKLPSWTARIAESTAACSS